jgi:ABC-2 type transport system permease protein
VAGLAGFVAAHYPQPAEPAGLLARFGLDAFRDRQLGGLSGGQQRRVAVALAFAGRPRVVLLDEPTTGLDVEARHAVWDGVRAFHADGGTVLLTSHYLDEVEALAGRVSHRPRPDRRGRRRRGDHPPGRPAPGHPHLRRAAGLPGVAGVERDGDRTLLPTADADRLVRDLVASLMPLAVMVFFILPNVTGDAAVVTGATATMVVLATLLACVGQFSGTVAALRESPWGAYLRTLPAGLAAGLLALLVAAVVFTLLGLAIGYTMSLRAAEVVTSVLVLVLAVGGGMFFTPGTAPALVTTVAPYLPTRGATDLVPAALTDHPLDRTALVMLGVWTVAPAALPAWGFHRDEGRRFR